jgi:hypothetical protein
MINVDMIDGDLFVLEVINLVVTALQVILA